MDTRKRFVPRTPVAASLVVVLLGLCASKAWAAEPAAAKKAPPTATNKPVHKVTHAPKRHTAKAKPVAEPVAAPAVDPVTDEHKLAVAQQVHTGRIACELGAHVTVTPDASQMGGFVVQMPPHIFHMTPVVSSTGAVRLEDTKNGAMWLQLGNKSMLMSTKLGQRLADECQSSAQLAVAEKLKHNPPPSLLDDTPGVARK